MSWSFTAKCPRGHDVAQEGFDRGVLSERIATDEPIYLYCAACDRLWMADSEQRKRIERAIGASA